MDGLRVITVPGMLDSRTYLLVCGETRDAVAIDAGARAEAVLDILQQERAALKYVLLTHCHFDHVLSADALCESTGAKLAIHRLDGPGLGDPAVNMSGPFGFPSSVNRKADIELEEGSVITIGGVELKTLHTPGHTPGSCCFLAGAQLFTGDTVFRSAYGNTGFPGGSMGDLMLSAARLLSLDADIEILPGHGAPTTVGRERVSNPIRI